MGNRLLRNSDKQQAPHLAAAMVLQTKTAIGLPIAKSKTLSALNRSWLQP